MKEWICEECGHAHVGDNPPRHCPQCGAPRFQFHHDSKGKWGPFVLLLFVLLFVITMISVITESEQMAEDDSSVVPTELNTYQNVSATTIDQSQ